MTSKLIGLGKKPWNTNLVSISVYIDTPGTALVFKSRKGAAGPVRYASYGPQSGAPQIDYRVHDINVDPLALKLALTRSAKLKLDEEEERAASAFTGKEQIELQTIKPLLPIALAGAGSFTAEKINMHARTNMTVISEFLAVRFETREEDGFTRVNLAE